MCLCFYNCCCCFFCHRCWPIIFIHQKKRRTYFPPHPKWIRPGKMYGKVQSVRIFSKSISSTNCGTDNNGQPTTTSTTTTTTIPASSSSSTTSTTTLNGPNYTNGGGSFLCNSVSATVAFIDIKSAAKAHSSENKIEERTLKTDYYEPHRHHNDDHHSLNATTNKLSSSINATTNNSSAVNNYNHTGNAVACSSSTLSSSSSSSCSGGVGSTVSSSTSSSSLTAAAASSSSTISAATSSNSGSLPGTGTLSSTALATNVPPSSSTAAIQQQQSSLGTVSSTTSATSSSTSAIAAAASSSSSLSSTATTSSSSSTTTSSSSSSSSPATPLSSNASLYGRHTPIRYNSTIAHESLNSNNSNNNQSASSSTHHHHHHHHSSSSSSSLSSSTAASQLSSSLANTTTTTTTTTTTIIGTGSTVGGGGGYSNFPGVSSSPKDDHISMTTSSLNDREESSRQNNTTITAICVRKISHRLTDSNIKDSLFYEFKRYGKIIQTLVRGQGSDRHAIVVFNKSEEAEKALKDSKDKQLLGSRVEITPCDYSDIVGDCNNNRNNNENIDNDYDVYHPRATRTLFVGNLDKEVSYSELAKKFSQFGEIMEIDIKKQNQPYAFIRFNNISSVVKAMRRYDNEPMGGTKLKLGYGKSFSSCCIWIGDYKDSFSDVKGIEKYLNKYGQVNRVLPDCEQRSVLCFFETHEEAKKAVEDLRQKSINGRRVNVDFASRDYQTHFLEKRTPLNNNNGGGGINNDNSTSNNSHRGRSGSWISSSSANSVDYDDQRTYDRSRSTSSYHHHQLNSRSSSSSSLLQVRSNSGNNGNNVNSGSGGGSSSSYSSLRQRSQTPPPSPPSTDSTSFNSRHSLSQSSSLHGGGGSNSRVSSKHDYHQSSRTSYGRYSSPNDDEDDVDEESHHSSSSNHKRESSSSSSRYSRSHHLSDSFLPTDMASPKIRRDSSPYSNLKLDSDFPHRSSSLSNRNSSSNLANSNSNSDDLKSSHDDVGGGGGGGGHGVSRRSNHSKLFHMSRRGIGVMAGDSPTPQHQSSASAQQQYRKSGLSSSSSSSTSSSNSRSPIGRESKTSSHYQDRTSVSPPPSPRLNHHHPYSYHDGDRTLAISATATTTSIINDGSNIGDHHSHAHQWRRKSIDDNNHHTSGTGGAVGSGSSDVLRLKSDSIIDINNSDVINNSSSSSSSTTSSSHREHGRDYRDRFRDSSNHRTNSSLLTTSSSLGSYQNRSSSDSYAKRRFNSSLEVDENSSDLPGHLERKKRLMACVEQSSSNSSLTNSSSTSLVNQTSAMSSNSNLATSNDNKSNSKNIATNNVTNLSISAKNIDLLNDVKLLHSSKSAAAVAASSRDQINTIAAASSSSSSSSSCSSTAGNLLVDHHLHQTSKRRLSTTANSVGITNNSGASSSSSIGISGKTYTENNFKDLKPILQYYLAEGNLNQHQTNAMLTLLNPEQSKATTLQLLNSSCNNKGSATIPSTATSNTNISTTVTSSSSISASKINSSCASGGISSVGNICGFSSTSSNSSSSGVVATNTASTTATASTSLATMPNNVNSATATTITSLASSSKTKTKDMCPTITLRTIDVCTTSVNQSLMDPRISGHNHSGVGGVGVGSGSNSSKSIYSSRFSCDNDLKNPKLSDTSSSASSNHHHHHSKHQSCEYGPSSPWNLPLPEFAKAQQLKSTTAAATILTGDNATKSHLSSLSLSLATAVNSNNNIVIQNSSTTAMISNPLSAAALSSLTNTTGTNNLTHIPNLTESSVRNLTGSSPKHANIMSPLGNLSPVPKHRLSRDRMSTETNSFDFKRSTDRIDLDDVSDTDMGGNFLNDDKLKPLDEKHNAWSGTSCTTPTLKSERTPTIDYSKYNIKKKSQSNTNTNCSTSQNNNSSNENDSTDLKNILSSSSVFDQDSKRLEHLNEKYEPKDVSTLDLDSIGSSTAVHKISLNSRTKFSNSIASSLVLPTDKTSSSSSLIGNSLDTMPKTTTTSTTPLNTPLSSSSSSSANSAFHYNHHQSYHHHPHHHHHHSNSSSTNNLIPTTTTSSSSISSSSVSSSSNMSRKFSTESSLSASNSNTNNTNNNRTNQIKKDYSSATTTPTTPGSAPVRSTTSMFPQFSRSSSIPTSSATAPNTPTTLVNNTSTSRTSSSSSSFNRKDSSGVVGGQSSSSCYSTQNNSNSTGGNQLSRPTSDTNKQHKLDPINKSSSMASNSSKTNQSSVASSSCSISSSSTSSKSGVVGGGDHQNATTTMKKEHNVSVNKSATVQDQQQQQSHHSNKNKHEIPLSTSNQSSNKNEFNRKEVERKNSSTGSDHNVGNNNNNNCTSSQDVLKDHGSIGGGGGNSGKSKTDTSTSSSSSSKHSSKESSLKDDGNNNNNTGNGNSNNNNNNNNREPTSRKLSMDKQNSVGGGSRDQQKLSSTEMSKTMDKEKKIDSSNTINSGSSNNNNNSSKKNEFSNQATKEKEREKMKKKSKEKEKEYSTNSNPNNKDGNKDNNSKDNKEKEQRRGEEKEKEKETTSKDQQCSKRKSKTIENSNNSSSKNSGKNKDKSKNGEKEKKKDKYKDKNKENNKNSNLHDYDDEPIYFSMYDKVKARSSANQNKVTTKPSSMDSSVRRKLNQLKDKRKYRKDEGKSSQDSEEDSDSSYDRKNFKSKSKFMKQRKRVKSEPSSSSSSSSSDDDDDDDEDEDDDDDDENEDEEDENEDSEDEDLEDFSKYSILGKKSKKLSNHDDDDSCSTIERNHYHGGRGLDNDYCGNKRNKSNSKREAFSKFFTDDDSSGTSHMISSISSSRSSNKIMGKSKNSNNNSGSSTKYPSFSISSDDDNDSSSLMLDKYLSFGKSKKKSKKEKDRFFETGSSEKGGKEYSSKNCGNRKMKNDKFVSTATNMDIKTNNKTMRYQSDDDDNEDDDDDDDDSITRAWKTENSSSINNNKKKKKKSKSSKEKQQHLSLKENKLPRSRKDPLSGKLNPNIYFDIYETSDENDPFLDRASIEAVAKRYDCGLKFRNNDKNRVKNKNKQKDSGRDRFSSSSSSCNKGNMKRMSFDDTRIKMDDEDSSKDSNVGGLLDKRKKKSNKNRDKFRKDSHSNDGCDKLMGNHSLAEEKHRIEMTSDMYMLLSPNSKYFSQKSQRCSLDYRPGSSSPPPRTPEISSPLSSPTYLDNIITSQVDENSYLDKTIDEELINESQTILRHCNENSSSDSCLSELNGGRHDMVTGDSNDFNALISGQTSLGNLVTIHQNDNEEPSKSVSPFEQKFHLQRNYDDEAILHLQKEMETDLTESGQSVGHFPGFETITTNVNINTKDEKLPMIPQKIEFFSSPETSPSTCKIENQTATIIMAKIEPNDAIILNTGDEIIGEPFNNESMIEDGANEQQNKPQSSLPTTVETKLETRIEDDDVECQRKMEDDLAVAALLQDMNDPCARITGPSVETDQIEPGTSLHTLQFIITPVVETDQPVMINEEQIMGTPEKTEVVTRVIMVDDQELKAAVQEIESAGQDILDKDDPKVSAVTSTSPIAVVMFNDDDDDQCEHELIVDENVLDKSLQESIDLAAEQGKPIIISTSDPNSAMTTESIQLIANKILSPKNTNTMIIEDRRRSRDHPPTGGIMFEIVQAVDVQHHQLQPDCTRMELVTTDTDKALNVDEINKTLLEEGQSAQLSMPILEVINQDSSGETLATLCMTQDTENFDAELFSKTTVVTMQLQTDDNVDEVDNSSQTIEQQEVRMDVAENESSEANKMDQQPEQQSAINDINNKNASNINNNNSQKRSMEDIEPDSTNEGASKPKRGRRTKSRKNSDSLMHSPRSEQQQQQQQETSVSLSNSLSINTNLPMATNVALLSPTSQSSVASDVSPGSQTKQPRGKQQQQQQQAASGSGASGGYSYSIRRSVRTAAVAASAVNSTTLEDLDDTDYSMDEQPTTSKDEQHEDDNKKKPSKRGRKKKNSPNVEPNTTKANDKTLLSATNTLTAAASSTTSAITGATNINIGTNANRPKSSISPYDVFEFTDEEDEGPLTLDHIKTPHFMSSSNVLDENKHLFDKRHQSENGAATTLSVDVSAVTKQQPEVATGSSVSPGSADVTITLPPTTMAASAVPTAMGTPANLGVCPKEYVSEVNQSGKLVIRLQDSGNNDGKTKEDVKFVEESASGSAAANNDNSTLKGVRKSARLMSAQGAKLTSDEIVDESTAMKNVATANNTNQNKVEGEKQGNATCKRVTRSNRKSDDGVQQPAGSNGGHDSEEEQDESKNLSRNYRVTRSRGSNVQEDPTMKKTESSSDDVTTAKSTNEETNEITMKNVDDGCQSTTATTLPTTMSESEHPISTVINVPITSTVTETLSSEPKKSESLSVIQSTGNVEKISNIVQTVVTTATTSTLSTTVTATTTIPTVPITANPVSSANVAVITSTPMTMITTPPTIKSPSIIDHHQDMKFIPSFSERLHNSTTTALKLKTGKGLIYESILSENKLPPIDPNITSAAAAVTTTSAPSLVTMSPVITTNNVNAHTTVHIKPKFQHPVGQQATEILRPISKSPNVVINSMNDSVKQVPPPTSSMTPPSMAESIKNLNINNGNQPPNTSAVPLNPTSKPFPHNKSVLQVAGVNAQPPSNPPELNLSYPGTLLKTTAASSHPNMSGADVFLQQQKEYLNSLQKQQQSLSFVNPQQIASMAQGRPPQPPVSGANQILNPSMVPMANYEFDNNICNQIHLWNAYPNAPGMRPQQMTMPQRFIFNAAANFPCHPPPPGLTPEQLEQATAAALQQQQQQKSHLVSKSQKDEMHRPPSSFNEEMKLHPETSFPVDMASLNASRNYQGIRHFGPILAPPPERFPNEAAYLQYGLNGQNRNLSIHPMNYGQDLSKQPSQLEPKRPSSKPFPSPAYRKDLTGTAESNVEILRNPVSQQFIANKDPHSQQPSAATTLNNNDPPLNMSTFQRVPSPNLPQPLSRPSSECSVIEQVKRITPPNHVSSISPAAAASLPPPPTSNYGPTPPQPEVILQRHPILWQGLLALKSDQTAVQMHYICGNRTIAAQALPFHEGDSSSSLRITQRMRIEPSQLNQLEKKIQSKDDCCILMALPCGRDQVDVLQQSNNLKKYFITYLQSKYAAGIVNDSAYGYITHIFPPGEFSEKHLMKTAPEMLDSSLGISHLMVVITTGSNMTTNNPNYN